MPTKLPQILDIYLVVGTIVFIHPKSQFFHLSALGLSKWSILSALGNIFRCWSLAGISGIS